MDFFKYFIENYIELRFGVSFVLTDIFFALGITLVFCQKIRCDSCKHFFKDLGFRALQFAATWFFGVFLCNFIYYITDFRTPYNLQIVIPLQIAFYALAFNRSIFSIKVVLSFFYYTVFTCSLLVSGWVGALFDANFSGAGSVPVAAIVQGVFIVICCVCSIASKIKYLKQIDVLSSFLLLLISAISITVYKLGMELNIYKVNMAILPTIGFVAIEIIAFFMFTRSTQHMNKLMDLYATNARNSNMDEIAQVVKADIEKLKSIRHELKNSYAYMEILLKENKYGELDEYFKKNMMELYDCATFALCGNFVIDHILNIEISKAKPKNISIEFNIAIAPVINVVDSDLCHLLLNLIDNAIEAVDRENFEGEKRKIEVNMNQNGDILFVQVINAAPIGMEQGEKEDLLSSKNSVLHGYGLKIVKKTVEKYNGSIRYMAKGGLFYAEAVLFLNMNLGNNDAA